MTSLGPRALFGLLREARAGAGDERRLVVAGARELAGLLAKELRAGGDGAAVVEQGPFDGAAALVWMGAPDEAALRRASESGLAIVGVSDGASLPYVLDTDLVVLQPGRPLPVVEIARALARVLGAEGVGLAARLPVLRGPVVDELIATAARRNGLIAAAVWVPGADLPILTLNQLRLVTRIALASGRELSLGRLLEFAGVLGAGFGSRGLARRASAVVPVAGLVCKAAVAYGATRAIGEAARSRFEQG